MSMMDDFDNVGSILKRLDELDAKHYAPTVDDSLKNLTKMDASSDLGLDNNASDFDNSDDLASLLDDDDDDDIFAKKVFGNPPEKSSTTESKKSSTSKKVTSTNQLPKSPSKEVVNKPLKDKTTYDDFDDDDVLNEFLESNVSKTVASDKKLTSPQKIKSKENSVQNEDDDFLDDLSQFSPSKNKTVKTIPKTSDISDNLSSKNISSKAAEERRGSVFDDFLQKLSSKDGSNAQTTPDTSDKNLKNDVEVDDEDILGAYIPSVAKKNDSSLDLSKSPKKRGSLSKQVSFKDLADDFPETVIPKPKMSSSPVKSKSAREVLPETEKNEKSMHVSRSEKANLNENEDMDWLNYFSPKKGSKSLETKEKSNDPLGKFDSSIENKSKPVMKRQSSADWLGLSDSKALEVDAENIYEPSSSVKKDSINKAILKPTRPKTVNMPIVRSRLQETNKIDNQLEDNDFINSSSTVGLSHILKDTDLKLPGKKSKSSSSFLNESSENENTGSVSKDRRNSKVNSNIQVIRNNSLSDGLLSDIIPHKSPDHFDKTSRNLPQSHEHYSALQSMQQMLDDCIKEKNKLLKENEATKFALEEKIKASEELHKSEKKMLEDSFKIQESSLKQEFEVKFKSLEERLNFVTQEKEKQAKNFEEKIQNLLKEHQFEIQRLKELHNQSINVMKQDHEDALSRLKKLKEQEIEAIFSTQMHSKSLQHLSDQLEARANELASLENKIEERNQSTLREKQLFLDAKEKNLKALQSRLERQLDDSEEEKTRLQQLILRLESRLQKQTMENEEDQWETRQLKAKLTIQQKYLEEEQKLNQYQIEKEKEKLKMAQDSLLQEQKTVLLQLAQERQLFTQEKIDLQALANTIKEEEAKLNVKKVKEESSLEAERQFLSEEKNKLHFEKERIKQEFYQLERERDSLIKEKQQLKQDRETLHEQEMDLRRKSAEIEEMASAAAQAQEKGRREHAEALAIKKEHQHKMQQYSQQMQVLMDKERDILSEREKLIAEKMEFEKDKSFVLCTKCKLSIQNPLQVSATPSLNMPVLPLPSRNGLSHQVQPSFMDPNLVIWHITAQKDREFLQDELAFLKSLKEGNKKKNGK